MTGETNYQGHVTRKVLMGGIILSYLRIKEEPSLSPSDKAAVEAWIRNLGYILYNEYITTFSTGISNHMYSAGVALMAAGIATGDMTLYNWGATRPFQIFVSQLQPNGTLPQEVGRGQMAVMYHGMSAGALSMIAYMAAPNGIDFYPQGNNALARLTSLVSR